MHRRFTSASILAGAAALVFSSAALAGSGPVLVSGPSPYAGCTPAATQTGRNYLNAEVEPQLAVNPTNTSNAIGQWHQDRWSNGGSRGIAGAFTTNGGGSWTETTVPSSNCTPGGFNFERSSDPWVSFGPDGTAYSSVLELDGSDDRTGVSGAVSHDGGQTWVNQQLLESNPNGTVFSDKNSVTADPVHAGVAYMVWDNLLSHVGSADAFLHAAQYTGPAVMSKTTDGGVSWSPVQSFIDTMNRQQTIGNVVLIDPRNGTVFDFTDLIAAPNTPFQGTFSNSEVAFVKSQDGGATWSQPQVIAPFDALGVIDPNTGQSARVGDGLQEVAIDPASGKLYVVWESSTNFNKNINQAAGGFDNEVLLTTSSDGGASWSTPTAIVGPRSLPVFTPTVAVGANGVVAVTYYDSKDLSATNTTTWPISYFVTYSLDKGATFSAPQRIAGPFDEMSAPVARGFFLGDYEGLQSMGSGFLALFAKTNCNLSPSDPNAPPTGNPLCGPASSNVTPTPNTNPNDVFSATLTPPKK